MIEFKSAGFAYGDRPLLKDINLKIAKGSFHFLTGPSGSGKSTFLKMCYLELMPTMGEVSLFNQGVNHFGRDHIAIARRKIGVVHQDCDFLDHLMVSENILLPILVSGKSVEGYVQNMRELLNWVGLNEQASLLPPALSGGERQRAALARALIASPELIIADEPTGNIDWEMGQQLLTLLVELNRLGKTILIATHDKNLIRFTKSETSARVLRIKDRTVQLAGVDL